MRNLEPILLVEDDRLDTMMVKQALKDLKVLNPLVCSGNGKEALDYLKDEHKAKPCVIFSDLNMPQTNGVEFLRTIKADERLKRIPVVVLTASAEEQDIFETFNLGVAGYVIKPFDYKKLVEAIRTIAMYWTLSELPEGE
jgi:CheY-like chemotaxis protein